MLIIPHVFEPNMPAKLSAAAHAPHQGASLDDASLQTLVAVSLDVLQTVNQNA
jgi:hypothetical protein